MTQQGSAPSTLLSLEVFRGIAAMLVVMLHLDHVTGTQFPAQALGEWTKIGGLGVDFFFVLSGFLMFYIHHRHWGKTSYLAKYTGKRLVRIMPMYWVAMLSMLTLTPFAASMTFPAGWDWVWNITLLPPPSIDGRILGVSWTLSHELLFYTLFATLLLHRTLGVIVIALWAAGIGFAHIFSPEWVIRMPVVFSLFNVHFFTGLLAGWWALNGPRTSFVPVFTVGMLTIIGLAVMQGGGMLEGMGVRLTYGVAAMLLIVSCVHQEARRSFSPATVWRRVGQGSYSLYLLHIPVAMVIFKLLLVAGITSWGNATLSFSIMFTLTTWICLVVSEKIEMPITRHLRDRFNL